VLSTTPTLTRFMLMVRIHRSSSIQISDANHFQLFIPTVRHTDRYVHFAFLRDISYDGHFWSS
jgi:hypothetical protein